jgi:spermidine/putrescine transport system ATP-binding protein
MIQDYNAFEPDTEVGLIIRPADIQVMHKERSVNTYEGEIISENKVKFLNAEWECEPQTEFEAGQKVQVSVNFSSVDLIDHPEDGTLEGEVYFLLYKGNHYHLTVMTDHREYIWVDTNDIWDKGDLVGINIAPKDIKITKLDD